MWQFVQLLAFAQLVFYSSAGSWRRLQDDVRRAAAVNLGTVTTGDPLSFDVTSYFPPNQEFLSLIGLSAGTGLVIRRTGLLEGTLSSVDKAKTSPSGTLDFTVLARNTRQQLVQRDFSITVAVAAVRPRNTPQQQQQSLQAQVQFRSVNVDHNISDISDACQGRIFRFSAARFFTSTNLEPLTYSLSAGTVGAFFIDPATGDITGMIDLATNLPPQPMDMQITAQDSSNLASFKLRVNFRQPGLLQTTSRPTVPKAYVGVPWLVDVGSSFVRGPFPIVITWDVAPPLGTGLRLLSSEGTTWIRGVPNDADFLGQRQLAVKADDGCNSATMAIPVTILRPSPPTVLPCNTVVPPAYLRRAWFWDASACFESDTSLTFALSGLAKFTGLSIDTLTGAISGVVTPADAATPDFPWSATVTAFAPLTAGGLSSNMTFFLWVKIPVNPLVLVPRKGQLPSLSWVGQTISINYAALFQSKNTLVYTITELPDNSGLRFSESMGTLSGVVQREAAAAPQPVLLILTADDLMGGIASFNHSITFVFPNIPQWRPFDTVPTAYFNVPYSLDLYKQFQDPGQLNMVLSGLPTASGLFLNASTGVLAGTPSQSDVNASQLDLTLRVDDGRGGVGAYPFSVPIVDYRSIIEQPLPLGFALVDTPFSLNLGLYFQATLGRILTVTVSGLPSSFFFNTDTGMIVGTASRRDLAAPQPFAVVIQVYDGVVTLKRTWLLSIVEANTPPVASQIPAAEATSGVFFLRDIKPYFSDPDHNPLVYSLSGLPRGTGLAFDGINGILSGAPTFADVTVTKPAMLTITADDRKYKGTVQAVLSLTVRPVNNPPFVSIPIPSPATAVQGRRFFGALSQHFVDPDVGDVLLFSVNGLPPGSGLSMDPTGALSGFPNNQDLAASPLRVNIKADDNRGGIVFGSFDLIVQPLVLPPVALDMPALLGQEGQPIFMNVKQYFQSNESLQYVIDGLAPDTGIQLGFDSGLLAGTPTKVDVTGPNFRTVKVYVHNSQGGKTQGTFQMRIKPISRPPIALPIPNLQGTVGQLISYDMTKFFTDPDFDPLIYSISGLPKNSGLSISPLGLFSGTPLPVDGNISPLTLTVVASDDGGMQSFSVFSLTLAKNYKAPMSDPIPPSRAVMSSPFQLDLKPYFRAYTARALQFAIVGLPKNTGLSLDKSAGVLAGIPNSADLAASGQGKSPMKLLVQATEGGANANSTLLLTIRKSNTGPVLSSSIPPATATVGEVFAYDLTSAFSDDDNDDLIYGMTGMPSGSGLTIDPQEGLVRGTPLPAACLWTMPLNLVISASDGIAPPVTTPFLLTIVCGDIGIHFVGSIPDGLAYIGKLWLLDMSPFFEYNGPYPVRFSGTGFPSGSGFVIAANGIAYGQPTSQDCRTFAESKVIRIEADDGHQSTDIGYFPFRVDCSGKTAQGIPGPLDIPTDAYVNPLMTLYVGYDFSFDVSQGFAQLRGQNLQYSAMGLPPGTGIKFDPYGLRVYGTPNAQDCANNPLTVLITGQNGKVRRQSVIFMMFPSCDPLAAPQVPVSAFDPIAVTLNNALPSQFFPMPQIQAVSSVYAFNNAPVPTPSINTDNYNQQTTFTPSQQQTTFTPSQQQSPSQQQATFTPSQQQSPNQQQATFTPSQQQGTFTPSQQQTSSTPSQQTTVSASQQTTITSSGQVNSNIDVNVNSDNRSPSRPVPSPAVNTPSTAKCGALGWSIPLGSKNLKVCATDNAGPTKCSPVTYSVAQQTCADLGGRLCNADELQQDVGIGGSCGELDSTVVWSRTACQSANGAPGVVSTGGSSKSAAKGWCVAEPLIKNPARCCADFEPGTEFRFGGISYAPDGKSGRAATLQWSWTAYRSFEVSIQLPTGKWGKAVTLSAGQPFTLGMTGSSRTVRIVPIGANDQSEKKQTRVVDVPSP